MSSKKSQTSHAVFSFGRMNPPTSGHSKLIDKVKNKAQKFGADHHIFVSHSQDPKKNPLSHESKVSFVKKMNPGTQVHPDSNVKTPIEAMKHLHSKGYKKVTMVVGSDRKEEMHKLLHKYNGKEYNFDHIEIKSAGQRDPDAEGVSGMSASKMREHAKNKDFKSFRGGVSNPKHARALYKAVRKGMQLENKAIFIVGGPCSGKDIIIRESLNEFCLLELNLEKLHKAILETKNLPELFDNPNLLVNGNAENFDKIYLAKSVLENMGYETSMIFVHTDNDISKQRNDSRREAGLKTLDEDVREKKFSSSYINMQKFFELFNPFILFDNSKDVNVSEEERVQIETWLNEVQEKVLFFLEKKIPKSTGGLKDACWSGYTAVGMKKKNGKLVPNCVPIKEASHQSDLNPNKKIIAKGVKGVKSIKFVKKFPNLSALERWLDKPEADDYEITHVMNESIDDDINSLFEKKFLEVGTDYTASYHKKNTPNQPNKIKDVETGIEEKKSLWEKRKETKEKKTTTKQPPQPMSNYYDSRIGAVPAGGIGMIAYKTEEKEPRLKSAGVEGFNKPKRTPGHPTKSHIVVAKDGDKKKTIRFGEQGAETAGKPKEGESDRMKKKRASFKARHSKNIAKGKMSAAYWANRVKW